jgi:hypothetical protein
MARVELDDVFLVEEDVERVKKRLRLFVKNARMQIADETDDEIRFEQGSQFLTRFLGGWFVSSAWLPKGGSFRVRETNKGVRIRARIEETLGFGILDPLLASKYESFFARWMNELRREFEVD